MKRTWIIIGIVALVILVVIVWPISSTIGSYNRMVKLDQKVKETWAQVENVYQRRLDMIPNLVNTVKGASAFEKETLTEVIEARAKATQITIDPTKMTKENLNQFQQVQGQLGSSLGRLLASFERYPELKATDLYKKLQDQIEGSENRIATERRSFNEAVNTYNTEITSFPGVIFASWFKFKEKPFFTADVAASKAPKVDFESSSKKDK